MTAGRRAAETYPLTRRYPRWTIWFGPATGHWFALPPADRDIGDFVEATTVQKLISAIEVIEHAPILNDNPDPLRNVRRSSNPLRFKGVPPPPNRRVPVVAWPGSTAR
jgi:hypothetical protein